MYESETTGIKVMAIRYCLSADDANAPVTESKIYVKNNRLRQS